MTSSTVGGAPVQPHSRLQVDISPDTIKSGRSLVLLMSASSEEVEGVAVQVVSVFGHISTSEERQTTSFLQGLVSGIYIICRPICVGDTVYTSYRIPWLHFHWRKEG